MRTNIITAKDEIRHLKRLLQHRDRWYINVKLFDDDVAEYVKGEVDDRLSNMSTTALYSRYLAWQKSDPIMGANEDYYNAFLNQVAIDLGNDCLKGKQKDLYSDTLNCSVEFI